MVLLYYFAYLALEIVCSSVYAENNQKLPFIIFLKKDTTQNSLDNLLKSVLITKQKNVQDISPKTDRVYEDFVEDDDMNAILGIMDIKKNLFIRQNAQETDSTDDSDETDENMHSGLSLPANVIPENDKNKIYNREDNSTEYRKGNWRSSCDKKAAKQCKKACVQALRRTCSIYRCKSNFKRSAKKECRASCREKLSIRIRNK